jgi:hypothetical protein
MKVWYTFGAFGDTVIELRLADLAWLCLGFELRPHGTGTVICLGKSKLKSFRKAPTREEQLKERP